MNNDAVSMTPRQALVFKFVKAYLEEWGDVAPTFQEIIDGMNNLEERGCLYRLRKRRRAIKLGRPAVIKCPHCHGAVPL